MTLKINGATGGSVSLDAPDNTSPSGTDVTLTLPTSAGSSGQVLTTDGSGTLSFTTLASDAITEGNTTVECVDTGSNGHITFDTEGSEAARFDSSGRLLVGTSTNLHQASQLQVVSAVAQVATLQYSADNGSGAYLNVRKSRGTAAAPTEVNNGDALGGIVFQGYDGAAYRDGAYLFAEADGTWTDGGDTTDNPTRLTFSTTADGASSPTERMRIQSAGSIQFQNTSEFYCNPNNSSTLGRSANRWSAVWASNGTIQTSDERLKTEVTDSTLATDFIKALRPVSYKWIEGGKRHTGEYDEDNNWVYESVPGQRTHWGFIAQEVKEAVDAAGVDFGGWVLNDKDDPESTQSLRYDQFIAPLTKALQEAITKIETLEIANASLEARLTALEGGAS